MTTHPVETVRVDERGKSQLVTLKRRTGLKNWNVLCRWAVCVSLAEESRPAAQEPGEMSNVEMTWHTFAGKNGDLFTAVLAARCERDRLGNDRETLAEQFRLHLQRGLTFLVANDTRSVTALASQAFPDREQ